MTSSRARALLAAMVLTLLACGAHGEQSAGCIVHLIHEDDTAHAQFSNSAREPWQGALELHDGERWRVLGTLTEKTASGGRIEVRYVRASDAPQRNFRVGDDADDPATSAFWDAWDRSLSRPWAVACSIGVSRRR